MAELPPGIDKVGDLVRVHPDVKMDMVVVDQLRAWVQSDGPPVRVRVEVDAKTRPPSAPVRRAMDKELFDPRRVVAVALVHQGPGFRSRLIRGVLTAIAATRRSPPIQVFENLADADTWLSDQRPV